MDKESFSMAMIDLLPNCKKEAIPVWFNFAAECVDNEQFVDFMPETNKAAAIEKWLNSIYAGLYFIRKEFGENIASQICNLSLSRSCLYPGEMKPAAEHLRSGGDINKVIELAVAGRLDGTPPFFSHLEDAIDDMSNSPCEGIWTLPECIKQFSKLEETLQGQKGLYSEWVRFSYETFEAYEVTPAEFVNMLCDSFKQVNDHYGVDIARALYGIINEGALLPSEILKAAEYLNKGGKIEDVPEMAHNGLFESQLSMDSPS